MEAAVARPRPGGRHPPIRQPGAFGTCPAGRGDGRGPPGLLRGTGPRDVTEATSTSRGNTRLAIRV